MYEEFIYQVCLEVRIQPLLTLSVMSIHSPQVDNQAPERRSRRCAIIGTVHLHREWISLPFVSIMCSRT